MSKSATTIAKEIEKEAYAKSPIGLAERRITKFYDGMKLKGQALPEDIAKKIYNVRDENEKWQLEYIEQTTKQHRIDVDNKLLESFNKELEIIDEYLKTNSQNTPENV